VGGFRYDLSQRQRRPPAAKRHYVRKTPSEGGEVSADFSRPEVLAVLKNFYQNLEEKAEVKLHKCAPGDEKKK